MYNKEEMLVVWLWDENLCRQVTGRFRGSNNPFARGFFRNLIDVFCSPQRPRYSPCDHESENYFRQKLKNGKLSSSSFPIWDNNHNKRFALDHNNYKNSGNGCDDFNSNSNRLKRRLQPAISTSGNIYALNEKGVAELVHLPSNFSSDETQPLTTDKSFDMIITQAKDKIVTSLSRSSSRITIDDLSVLKMASNSQINRNDAFGTIFSSHCNLLDESASIRITNKNNDENFPCQYCHHQNVMSNRVFFHAGRSASCGDRRDKFPHYP
uniref:Uncharacterized protein n=1 Tax=Romanomermis culicivorax TaxID=13658 RepID=A0A915I7M8_ROMCU